MANTDHENKSYHTKLYVNNRNSSIVLIQTSKNDELTCQSVTRNTTAITTGKTGRFTTTVLYKFLSRSITADILQTVSHGNNFTSHIGLRCHVQRRNATR